MIDPLSQPVRQLVDAGVATIEQLEALIAVAAADQPGCTTERLASSMRASVTKTSAVLESLEALRVVARDASEPTCWRIVRPDLLPPINAAAEAMVKHRRRVVNHFYAHRLESLRAFSDAFRLRKDP